MSWIPYNHKPKYHNTFTHYKGDLYHSKKEAAYAADLDMRIFAHDIKSWERQVTIPLDIQGEHVCNYIIDFVITHNDNSKEYAEVKGMPTPVFKIKKKLFEILHKDKRLTVI